MCPESTPAAPNNARMERPPHIACGSCSCHSKRFFVVCVIFCFGALILIALAYPLIEKQLRRIRECDLLAQQPSSPSLSTAATKKVPKLLQM